MQTVASLPRERERWLVSKMLGVGPFDPAMLSLTDPQIRWIVAQFSLDSLVDPQINKRFDEKVAGMMAVEG